MVIDIALITAAAAYTYLLALVRRLPSLTAAADYAHRSVIICELLRHRYFLVVGL